MVCKHSDTYLFRHHCEFSLLRNSTVIVSSKMYVEGLRKFSSFEFRTSRKCWNVNLIVFSRGQKPRQTWDLKKSSAWKYFRQQSFHISSQIIYIQDPFLLGLCRKLKPYRGGLLHGWTLCTLLDTNSHDPWRIEKKSLSICCIWCRRLVIIGWHYTFWCGCSIPPCRCRIPMHHL